MVGLIENKKEKRHTTMHTTAIAAMRGYCVYAGTLGATKNKIMRLRTIIESNHIIIITQIN